MRDDLIKMHKIMIGCMHTALYLGLGNQELEAISLNERDKIE